MIENTSSPDTSLASSILDLSGILYISNMDTMIPLCNQVIKIAEGKLSKSPSDKEKTKLLNALSGAYNNIAFIMMSTGEVDSCLAYLHKSVYI